MAEIKKKDFWDKISILTPLIIAILGTIIGVVFTKIYDYRKLQLDQIQVLEKYRPLLLSDKFDEREYAYYIFISIGYEKLALKLIKNKNDVAGKGPINLLVNSNNYEIKNEAKIISNELPPVIYFQISNEIQRIKAQKIKEIIEKKGYYVKDIENVNQKAIIPDQTEIRYFNVSDNSLANDIKNIFEKEFGLKSTKLNFLSKYKIPKDQIEIWFSKEF